MAYEHWKRFSKFVDTFQTADECSEWCRRYSLKPVEWPIFAAGSNAIEEIRTRCGVKQAVLANACGVAKSTFSGYEKSPENVTGVMVRRMIDGAERWWSGTPEEYAGFITGLLDDSCTSPEWGPNQPLIDIEDICTLGDIETVWGELTYEQFDAVIEIIRSMVAANRSRGVQGWLSENGSD